MTLQPPPKPPKGKTVTQIPDSHGEKVTFDEKEHAALAAKAKKGKAA